MGLVGRVGRVGRVGLSICPTSPTSPILRLLIVAAAVLFATGARAQTTTPPLRVLFIGNSLTSFNNLPVLFESLAAGAGQTRPITRTVAVDGFSLEDHWNQGDAQKAIASGPWDIVVLQQGPSALVESRRLLVAYAERFAKVIRAAGARPAMYMVWPSTERSFDFPNVSTSYRSAARAVSGDLYAVGDAWRKVLREHRDIKLYSNDGLHPTVAGSYLAAVVIYRQIYPGDRKELPAVGVTPEIAKHLQGAAP